jgi:hypothetical protein
VATEAAPSDLKTAWDTIVAPREAFTSIRAVPTWGWALALAIILTAVGSYLSVPALQHAIAGDWPRMVAQNPAIAAMPADRQQRQLHLLQRSMAFGWVVSIVAVPFYCLVNALLMLVFDRLGRGDGSLAKYWSAACNIALVQYGLQNLVLGIIALARGGASYTTMKAFQLSMPSLAFLAPNAAPKLVTFLATINVFTIWSTALAITALLVVGRVRGFQAYLGGLILYLYPTFFAVWGSR